MNNVTFFLLFPPFGSPCRNFNLFLNKTVELTAQNS